MRESTPSNKFRAYYGYFFREFPNFSVRRTQHARIRMQEKNIGLPQIRTVLMTGSIVRVEPDIRSGLDKYRVSGHDADGKSLEVVVNLVETETGRVDIVTVIG